MTLRSQPSFFLWLTLAAVALGSSTALAQAAPPKETAKAAASATPAKPGEEPDTQILSDTLNYDDVKKESTFTGNVILTRGQMTLRADTLVMHEDPQGFQYGTATVQPGHLVFIRQENPEKFEVLEAKGLRAEYNGKTDEIIMIGKAVVTKFVCGKPFDTIAGDRITYNQSTNTYQASGGANSAGAGGRVRSIAKPSAKAQAAAADCQKKPTRR